MARLRIVLDRQVGPRLKRTAQKHSQAVRDAIRLTAHEAADEIALRGRDDIASAGNFGSRWTEGFQVKVTQGGGHTVITATMAVPYWHVFQFGNVTHGRPLLWIPLSFADDAKGVNARDYPGQLFRVDRKSGGAPLLLTPPGIPKYFGKEFVTIPKKFHLIEIAREVAQSIGDMYRRNRKT